MGTALGLTPREFEIVKLMASIGHTKGVATKLGISNRTVEHHLAKARRKLGCESTFQAVALVEQARLGEPTQFVAHQRQERALAGKRITGLRPWFWPITSLVCVVLIPVIFAAVEGKVRSRQNVKDFMPIAGLQRSFIEHFIGDHLEREWKTKKGIGEISLQPDPNDPTAHFLRYELKGSTRPDDRDSTWLYRFFRGDNWQLHTQAIYHLPKGMGRQLYVDIIFGNNIRDRSTSLRLWVNRDDFGVKTQLMCDVTGPGISATQLRPISLEKPIDLHFSRVGGEVSIWWSPDGKQRILVSSCQFDKQKLPDVQAILLSGESFGGPGDKDWGGGWVDYRFFELNP